MGRIKITTWKMENMYTWNHEITDVVTNYYVVKIKNKEYEKIDGSSFECC